MAIEHVLAVVPVTDIDAANTWYETFFGRAADNNPMPVLLEWQVIDGGWVQVWVDEDRAGSGLLNIAVDDLDKHVAEARNHGLAPREIEEVNKGVRLCTITDPDGNMIRLIGGFRVKY